MINLGIHVLGQNNYSINAFSHKISTETIRRLTDGLNIGI